MSTIRAMAATTASTPSLANTAAAAPKCETRHGRREPSLIGGVLMTVVFLGLLGATIALAVSAIGDGHGFMSTPWSTHQ